MRPLNFWENERVVYERLPGAVMPTIKAVMIAKKETDHGVGLAPLDLTPLQFVDPGDVGLGAHEESEANGSICASPTASASDALESTPPPRRRKTPGRTGTAPGNAGRRRRSRTRTRVVAARNAPQRAVPVDCDVEDDAIDQTPEKAAKEDGYIDTELLEGSMHCCRLRVGKQASNWLACDVRVPPQSFNAPEKLGAHQALIVSVISDGSGDLMVCVDGNLKALSRGDKLAVRPGSEYHFRNGSDTDTAHLKIVLSMFN
jgi:hypothetical protein